MKVNEIFYSIDGEGIRAGELAIFIRLAGCNLRCSYCDTEYALKTSDGEEWSVDDIISECKKYNTKNITLTGGEPLIHKDVGKLINALVCSGYNVNIETNGSIDVAPYVGKCLVTLDYKTISSGENDKMLLENIAKLTEIDILKIVMQRRDANDVCEMLRALKPKCYIYLSPIYGEIEPHEIVDFMKYYNRCGINTSKMRVQLQLHKYIWQPEKRGV